MPYGFPKALGGDNAQNDDHMESMVAALMKEGHDKVTAIRIAKSQLEKHEAKQGGLADYLASRARAAKPA